jgi:hypothetical protein
MAGSGPRVARSQWQGSDPEQSSGFTKSGSFNTGHQAATLGDGFYSFIAATSSFDPDPRCKGCSSNTSCRLLGQKQKPRHAGGVSRTPVSSCLAFLSTVVNSACAASPSTPLQTLRREGRARQARTPMR